MTDRSDDPTSTDTPTTDDTSSADAGRTRTRTRSRKAVGGASTRRSPRDADADAGGDAGNDDRSHEDTGDGSRADDGDGDDEGGSGGRRRGRRGRRGGRGGRGRGGGGGRGGDGAKGRSGDDGGEDAPATGEEETEEAIARGGTRMAAKRGGRSGGSSRGGRSGGRDQRQAGVSEEVRRALLDGPPRTMLVTSQEDRTQIAVLEDRTVAEHYVTRKEDVTYVGNIYMARVQNVLPGMEAAFLDIGKGRNGVLYAGEVLYDELDLDENAGANPRIEDALKPGQTVLVQVTKDPMGTKGPRLTMNLSLAGRYMVLAPNSDLFGISRKLTDDERDRLRRIVKKLKPSEHGVIVRTAASEASDEAIEADLERLLAKWEAVSSRAAEAKALTAVYEEPPLVVKVIRDNFGPDFTRCIVDDAELHAQVRDYLDEVAPDLLDKIELYEPKAEERETPKTLFAAYDVEEQLRKAMDRKVWLPSGGYLIIEATEAMKVIDVNTGKFTGGDGSNLEEVVLKTNLEAAEE
ncbi:MAG: Rne/Rng family ribonuclease, partial [Actinobacteria bacterium]|nr:Rne/Rng family ribonuclease [Actinomycetota bacterium]